MQCEATHMKSSPLQRSTQAVRELPASKILHAEYVKSMLYIIIQHSMTVHMVVIQPLCNTQAHALASEMQKIQQIATCVHKLHCAGHIRHHASDRKIKPAATANLQHHKVIEYWNMLHSAHKPAILQPRHTLKHATYYWCHHTLSSGCNTSTHRQLPV